MKRLNDSERASVVVGLSMLKQTLAMTLGSATFDKGSIEGLLEFDFMEKPSVTNLDALIRKVNTEL